MSIALLVMTDGRFELLERTLTSFRDQVSGDVTSVFVHDDSADRPFIEWMTTHLRPFFPESVPIFVKTTEQRSGFGGAIRSAWSWLAEARNSVWIDIDPFDFVFHLEDDFIFNHKLDLDQLRGLLIDYPYLAQMALKRQPWGSDAEYANGFMQAQPDHYTQREDDGDYWVETKRNWTTNPSLFRADLLATGWPDDPHSEGKYGFVLKEQGLPWGGSDCVLSGGDVWQHDPNRICGHEVQFGIFGRIEDPPLVHHIGDYRVGTMY